MVSVAGSAFACGLVLCMLLVGTASSQSATAAPGTSNVSLCNTTNNGTVGANATTGNCTTNSSTPTTVPPTTTTPPPTTTAAPTPAPPTLSPCEAARFACDDTLSRCVRGSAFNRCGCLARYWRCLTDTACGGPTEADEELCADRASGLRCGTYDDMDTGWRVCPEDAGIVYDDTASGWIVALVFMSTALLLLLASLAYIGAVRGWYRDSDGRLMLNGKTPVEDKAKAIAGAYFPGTAMGRAFNAERRREERRRRKAQRKAQRGADASDGSSDSEDRRRRANPALVSAAAGLPAGAEPPEVVVMTPDAVERYKNYLRDRYDADEAQRRERRRQRDGRADDGARRGSSCSSEGSEYDRRPALIRTPPRARPAAGSPHDVSVGGVSLVRPASRENREFEKRYEAEMAALRAGASPASHDNLAQVALEIDVAEREIARGRSRLAQMLAAEREGMVRELSVGREASREGLPGDSFRDSYADTMGPGGRFSIRAPDGGDRHGGFGVGGNGDGGNPISLLFNGGGAEPRRRGVGSAATGSGGLRLATAANPPDVEALGRGASRSPLSQRHLDRLPGHDGGAPQSLTMEQLTRLDSSAFAPGHRNPLEQGPGQHSLLQRPRAAAGAGSPHGSGGGTHPLIMFARGASPTPSL